MAAALWAFSMSPTWQVSSTVASSRCTALTEALGGAHASVLDCLQRGKEWTG